MDMGANKKMKLGIAAIVMLLPATAVAAEGGVNVTLDRAMVFRIDEPASTVIVGNPMIADVAMQDRHTVVVTGKTYGSTNLIILDASNKPIIDEIVSVRAADDNTVSVYRKAARETFTCAPTCERTLSIGDYKESFEEVAKQITGRNETAVQAAGGGQ